MALTDLLPVQIVELAPPFRVLKFGARNQPKPIRVTGEQRAIQTWYPGSQKASVQVMGTKESDIPLEGRWDDPAGTLVPALGATVRIATARGLKLEFGNGLGGNQAGGAGDGYVGNPNQ